MVLETMLPSTVRRSSSFRRQRDDLGGWSALMRRHRFLLAALVLLTFLCSIYLYFAITLGATTGSCSGLTGARKASCQLKLAKSSMGRGKGRYV